MALDCLSLILRDASSPGLEDGFVFGLFLLGRNVDAHLCLSNFFRLSGLFYCTLGIQSMLDAGAFCHFCPPFSVSFPVLDSFSKMVRRLAIYALSRFLCVKANRQQTFLCVKAIRQQILRNFRNRRF